MFLVKYIRLQCYCVNYLTNNCEPSRLSAVG